MNKKYSVWHIPYNKRYLLTHPWKWFKYAWCSVRDAWRRSVYGWTYGDVWGWDNWFLHTAPSMLRYLADYGNAYPGRAPFETPERWHDWLNEMADLLDTGREDWQDEHNEYYEEYINNVTTASDELRDLYLKRARELAKQGENNVRRAMMLLGEHFYSLGD